MSVTFLNSISRYATSDFTTEPALVHPDDQESGANLNLLEVYFLNTSGSGFMYVGSKVGTESRSALTFLI